MAASPSPVPSGLSAALEAAAERASVAVIADGAAAEAMPPRKRVRGPTQPKSEDQCGQSSSSGATGDSDKDEQRLYSAGHSLPLKLTGRGSYTQAFPPAPMW